MEEITRENLIIHGIRKKLPWVNFTVQRQVDVCNSYLDNTRDACWEELSHMFVVYRKLNTKNVYNDCRNALSVSSQKSCMIHASQLLIITPKISNEDIALLCSPFHNNNSDYHSCLGKTIEAALIVSKNNQSKLQYLCGSLKTSDKEYCLTKMKNEK